MTAYRRNLLVGVVMLVALAALGWMILKFGGGPATWFTPPKMTVRFVADRADGIADGSSIFYRGVAVGRVVGTRLGNAEQPVVIDTLINRDPPLPANVIGNIKTNSLLGAGASIDLEVPAGPADAGHLSDGAELRAHYVGTQILPPEFSQLANELKETTRQLRESNIIASLKETVVKTGNLADSLNNFVSDEKLRGDLMASVANLRTATETANRIGTNLEKFSSNLDKLSADTSSAISTAEQTISKASGHIDDISRQVNDRLLQTAELLKTFNSVAAKIDQGKGTAGLLINDPKLYDSLVDTARQINLTIADVKRLVEQWEQEGAYFRLSK